MFLISHSFILVVALPLLAAPVVALLPWRRSAWSVMTGALLLVFLLAILINVLTLKASPLSYDLGNWPPPVGIEYLADSLNGFILLLIGFTALLCAPFLYPSQLTSVEQQKQPVFYALFLLGVSGLLGITMTNDIFNIYVFLEISSLATYALIASGQNRQALTAAFEYLILGTIGATFFLIGVGMLYMATGTLNISDLAYRLTSLQQSTLVDAGIAFLVLGLLLKVALFPLHMWLVQSYTYAPTPVSAFLSATATKVALYLMVRILYGVFGTSWVFSALPLNLALQGLAACAIIVGSLAAYFQRDAKRMLAFSSIAQIGYIVFALSLGTSLGLSAALFYLLIHGLAKATLFLSVAEVERARGSSQLSSFTQLGSTMPVTSICLTVAALSLLGIPLTAGFLGKWLLLKSALDTDHWFFFALLLVNTLMTALYLWKILEQVWLKRDQKPGGKEVFSGPIVALGIGAAASIYFGISSDWLMTIVQSAVSTYFSAGDL